MVLSNRTCLIWLFACILFYSLAVCYNKSKYSVEDVSIKILEDRRVRFEEKEFDKFFLEGNLIRTNPKYLYFDDNKVCDYAKDEVIAIYVIFSNYDHVELRDQHRKAISQRTLDAMGYKRVFVIGGGNPMKVYNFENKLIDEQRLHGDLLLGSFKDTHDHFAFKHIMALRWAAIKCPIARYIVKVDDNIVYDIFHIESFLIKREIKNPLIRISQNFLAGYVIENTTPSNSTFSNFYKATAKSALENYPPYLSGWLYITNAPTALRLVNEAIDHTVNPIDDVWITGVIRHKLGIPLVNLNSWYTDNGAYMYCCAKDLKFTLYKCDYFVGPNGGEPSLITEFQKNTEKCYTSGCRPRPPTLSVSNTCRAAVKLTFIKGDDKNPNDLR